MSLKGKILLSLLGNALFTTLFMLLAVAYLFNKHLENYIVEVYNKAHQSYIQILEHEIKELQNREKVDIKLWIGRECETIKGYFLTLPSGTIYGIQRKFENGCYFVGESIEEILKMIKFLHSENYAIVIYREWLDLKGQELDEYMKNKQILDSRIIVEKRSKEELLSYPLDIKGWEIHGKFLNKVLLMELPMWFQDGNARGKIVLFKDLKNVYRREYENFLLLLSFAVVISLMSSILLNRIASYLTKDINELTKVAEQIEMGNFEVVELLQKSNSKDEIGILKRAFYDAVNKIKELIKELELKNKELEELAYYDPLTNLPNRRYFFINAQTLIENAKRYDTSLSVIIIDIDNFKKVNDTFGHDAGDMLLRAFANILKSELRSSDVAARFGGEEFAVLLPNTNTDGAYKVSERIRKGFENTIVIYNNKEIKTTVSIGISHFRKGTENIDDLIREADEALYEAKSTGKNKVVIYKPKTKEHQKEDLQET